MTAEEYAEIILRAIALAKVHGADAALAYAIECGAIPETWHAESETWAEALLELEGWK